MLVLMPEHRLTGSFSKIRSPDAHNQYDVNINYRYGPQWTNLDKHEMLDGAVRERVLDKDLLSTPKRIGYSWKSYKVLILVKNG
ncbi:hypothetical protein ASD50_21485 [Mesorhizobium sp. Root552]|nr:hypothetical protein ASD50_21485 [Mesorhizobium sp. Root552]